MLMVNYCLISLALTEATLKIARTMLQNGIDRSTVMKMTGLSEDDLAGRVLGRGVNSARW